MTPKYFNFMKIAIKIIEDITKDERIPIDVRNEIIDKMNNAMGWE